MIVSEVYIFLNIYIYIYNRWFVITCGQVKNERTTVVTSKYYITRHHIGRRALKSSGMITVINFSVTTAFHTAIYSMLWCQSQE